MANQRPEVSHAVNSHLQVVSKTIAHSERATSTDASGMAWPYPLMQAVGIPNILPTKAAVIAGLSGHGKTQMLTSIINGHAESILDRHEGIHVHFSLEDPVEIYGARSLSMITGIPASTILSGKMTDHEKAQRDGARINAARKPVWVVGQSTDSRVPYVPMRRDTIEEALHLISQQHPIVSISLDYLNLVEDNKGYSFESMTSTAYEFARWFMGQELKVNGTPSKILMTQADPNTVERKGLAYPTRTETSNIKGLGYLADFFVAVYRPYTQYKGASIEMKDFPKFATEKDLFFLVFDKVKNSSDNLVFPLRVDWRTGRSRIDTRLLDVNRVFPNWRRGMEEIRENLPSSLQKLSCDELLNVSL